MNVTTATVLVFLLCAMGSSCGYLDEEILVDEVTFEEGFGVGGLGMSGHGSSGCGGFGTYMSRSATIGLGSIGTVGIGAGRATATMSDAEILELTEVDIVDVSEHTGRTPSAAEQMYYSALEGRNRSISQHY